MDQRDLAWLAGYLEGEGSFLAASKSNPYPCIQVMATDEDVIARVSALFGNSPSGPHQPSSEWSKKPRWTARVNGWGAVQLMRRLYPMMGERRQAQIVRAIYSFEDRQKAKIGQRAGEMIRRLVADGVSFREIAERIPANVTSNGVINWCKRNGCHPLGLK